jgi:pimeloyl-ACP methyl ester carboxylesterase
MKPSSSDENKAQSSALLISGWAHGIDAIRPMGDALSGEFEVQLVTGAAVLRDRKIPECDYIVTGSMGGLLAMELMPDSCSKLILISSTAKFCSSPDYPHGIHEKIVRRMIEQLKRDPETVLNEFFRNVHHPLRESRHSMALRENAPMDVPGLAAGLEYLLESDVRDRIATLDMPVLLLHGAEDRIIPVQASEWLHDHLPDSLLHIVEQDGHALPAHHFGFLMQEIHKFLLD